MLAMLYACFWGFARLLLMGLARFRRGDEWRKRWVLVVLGHLHHTNIITSHSHVFVFSQTFWDDLFIPDITHLTSLDTSQLSSSSEEVLWKA